LATDEEAESPTPPEETEKLLFPPEEKAKFDVKGLILKILGYASLIFIGISLFFPYWNDFTSTYQFISLWRMTESGIPYFHWEIIWNWQIYNVEAILSAIMLSFLIYFILSIVKQLLKRTFPGIELFAFCIFLAIPCAFGFPLTFDFPFGPLTPIYGPTWGLAFGWWALLFAALLAMIRKYYAAMLKHEKEESEAALAKI
jgi:hypothetical protein